MPHAKDTVRSFTNDSKGFHQQVVQCCAFSQTLFKFGSFTAQLLVAEIFHLGFQSFDLVNQGIHTFELALAVSSQEFFH